jgi:predicted metal-dependent hydrolase
MGEENSVGLLKKLLSPLAKSDAKPVLAKKAATTTESGTTHRVSSAGIEYRLERVRRHSIGLVITTDGLVIRAPKWTPIYEIDAAIAERQSWIETATAKQQARLSQMAELRDGGHVLFRGKKLPIEVRHGAIDEIAFTDEQCIVTSRTSQFEQKHLDDEIRRIAAAELPKIARDMATAANLPLRAVRLSSARTLWGSCTIDHDVRLNFRLIQLPPALTRHVVAHELAHLVEFNHSKRFWAIVQSLDPGSRLHRRAVKSYSVLLEL